MSSPTKFGEYLAAGVPVVLTDCIGDYSRWAEEFRLGVVLNPAGLENDGWSDEEEAEILRRNNFV